MEALDGRVLDGAVHPLDLSVGPGVLYLGEPVLDAMLITHAIEDVFEGVAIADPVGELDAVVCQHDVDGVGNGCDQIAQELGGHHLAGLPMEFRTGELGGTIDGNEQIELAFCGLHLGDVDMEVADRVALELLLRRLVAFDIRQATDAMALQTAMEGRAGQVRNGRLQRIEAVVERQQRVPPKGDDHRLFLGRRHRRSGVLRPSRQIGDVGCRDRENARRANDL
jgi:hypothetical protein